MSDLHPTQQAFLEIHKFVKKNKYFPSGPELAACMKPPVTRGMAQRYIMALEKMKLLERNNSGRIISIEVDCPEDPNWFCHNYYSPKKSHGKRSNSKGRGSKETSSKG